MADLIARFSWPKLHTFTIGLSVHKTFQWKDGPFETMSLLSEHCLIALINLQQGVKQCLLFIVILQHEASSPIKSFQQSKKQCVYVGYQITLEMTMTNCHLRCILLSFTVKWSFHIYMCILATWYPTINFIWKMRLSARGCIWYFGSAAWIHPAPSLCRQMVLLKNNFYYEVFLEVEVDFRISGNWLVATDLKNCVFPNTSLSWFHVAV